MINKYYADKSLIGSSGTTHQMQYMMNPLNENRNQAGKRGIQVYNLTDIIGITGRDEKGQLLSWGVQQPYFYLAIRQRNEIFRLCSPVFGVVSSRMKRIAGMDFKIMPMKKKEDEMKETKN